MAEITVGRGKSEVSFDPSYWDRKSDEELIYIIKGLTQDARDRIKTYNENGVNLTAVNDSISELKAIGSINRRWGTLSTGSLRSKSHEGLVYQARQLYNFHKWDFVSTEGIDKITARNIKTAITLKENFKSLNDLSVDDITSITEVLGALGEKIVEQYGSDAIVANEKIVKASKKVNLADVMVRIAKTTNGSQEELLDKLMEEVEQILSKE